MTSVGPRHRGGTETSKISLDTSLEGWKSQPNNGPLFRIRTDEIGAQMKATRTLLFVPGDRADRVAKALASAADAVVVDLEDAVAVSAKQVARESASRVLAGTVPTDAQPMVRLNGLASGWLEDDVRQLAQSGALKRLDAVLLPKCESPQDVLFVQGLLIEAEAQDDPHIRIIPILESARGVLAAQAIASASPQVVAIMFGPADLASQLGIDPANEEFTYARSHVVLAAAASDVLPLDGPHLTLGDPNGLAASADAAKRMGFRGKAAIHPEQLSSIHRAFTPTEEELLWARSIEAAFTEAEEHGTGAIQTADGAFIDYAIVRRAQAMLAASNTDAGAVG